MPAKPRKKADDQLLLALACGATVVHRVPQAAFSNARAGCGETRTSGS
jgi:hypothetical protein